MKTKLGISVAMLAALTYLMGLFSGYTVLVLLVGYILLCETDEFLRKSAVKALMIVVAFSLVSAVIGLIPNGIGVVDDFLNIFNLSFPLYFITRIVTFINSVLAIVQKLVLLVMAFMAWSGKTCKIPGLDDLVDKHM